MQKNSATKSKQLKEVGPAARHKHVLDRQFSLKQRVDKVRQSIEL